MSDEHFTDDPLSPLYRESFAENPKHEKDLRNRNTALLCIDMQYLDAAEGHGLFTDYETSPIPLDEMRYYFDRLKDTVLPNVHNLQNCFRSHGLEVIHCRIQSLTHDGRDRSKGHKRLEVHASPGSAEACFLEEVAPVGDEIVINKTASGVFASTNINYVLQNLGISSVYVVGVYTNECVETTVRHACDLGYLVTMVDDCCATVTPDLHEASLVTLRDRYARIITAEEAMSAIEREVNEVQPNY
ncbi:MAG: isochorismatase family cysteine hydrolase [Luteolibacter sp.]